MNKQIRQGAQDRGPGHEARPLPHSGAEPKRTITDNSEADRANTRGGVWCHKHYNRKSDSGRKGWSSMPNSAVEVK